MIYLIFTTELNQIFLFSKFAIPKITLFILAIRFFYSKRVFIVVYNRFLRCKTGLTLIGDFIAAY
jgi:hypothetical protein